MGDRGWGFLATLLACLLMAYVAIGLTWALQRGWGATPPDAYHVARSATPVALCERTHRCDYK